VVNALAGRVAVELLSELPSSMSGPFFPEKGSVKVAAEKRQ
jgi:hypothetical protein